MLFPKDSERYYQTCFKCFTGKRVLRMSRVNLHSKVEICFYQIILKRSATILHFAFINQQIEKYQVQYGSTALECDAEDHSELLNMSPYFSGIRHTFCFGVYPVKVLRAPNLETAGIYPEYCGINLFLYPSIF